MVTKLALSDSWVVSENLCLLHHHIECGSRLSLKSSCKLCCSTHHFIFANNFLLRFFRQLEKSRKLDLVVYTCIVTQSECPQKLFSCLIKKKKYVKKLFTQNNVQAKPSINSNHYQENAWIPLIVYQSNEIVTKFWQQLFQLDHRSYIKAKI